MTVYRNIWALLSPEYRRKAVLLLCFMLMGSVLEILGVGLTLPAIAIMMLPDVGTSYPAVAPLLAWLGNPSREALVVGTVIGLLVVFVLKNLYLAFLARQESAFAFRLQAELSARLFSGYLNQPYSFHLTHNSAELVHNVTSAVGTFTYGTVMPVMLIVIEGLTLFGIGVLGVVVEPTGALVVAVMFAGVGWAFHKATAARITRWGQAHEHHDTLRLQHLMQGLSGVKDVKLLGREGYFLSQFHLHNTKSAMAEEAQSTVHRMPKLVLETLTVAGLAAVVITMIAQGHTIVSIVPIVGFLAAAAFRLAPSVNRILGSVQTMRYALPVSATLSASLSAAVSQPEGTPVRRTLQFIRDITFNSVTFSYPDAPRPALCDVSLTVRRGESIGLIGANGSGKTTLVDVLLGLLTPTGGLVSVDGADIQQNLRGWQDRIGYVPQSIYLIDDTLRRNVAFGLPDDRIDNEALRKAVKAAQLEDFIKSLPEGLETAVGERGIRLSGGQRQRIGIARAIYSTPDVLVLDEATSSLDAEGERAVMEAVNALRGSTTLLIVAHRLTTVSECDRLYRLDHGRIVEMGTPADVLSEPPAEPSHPLQ